MNTDDTLNNTLTTLIQALTELQKRLSAPTQGVDEDKLHDTVRDVVDSKLEDLLDSHMSQPHVQRDLADKLAEYIDTDDIRTEVQENLDVSDAVSDWLGSEFSPSDYDLVTEDKVSSIVEDTLSEKLDGMVAAAVKDFSVTAEFRQAVRAAMVQLLSGEKA